MEEKAFSDDCMEFKTWSVQGVTHVEWEKVMCFRLFCLMTYLVQGANYIRGCNINKHFQLNCLFHRNGAL